MNAEPNIVISFPLPKTEKLFQGTRVWLLVFLAFALIGGCAKQAVEPPVYLPTLGLSQTEVKNRLLRQYSEWRGVPYRNGGQSRNGIDCSAFVQLTYKQKFGMNLPRTTRQQSKIGGQVTSSGLRPGDLILFKTSRRDRHIGIYLEKYKFIHVSTTSGVTISKMTDAYWHERYWQTRRVFN